MIAATALPSGGERVNHIVSNAGEDSALGDLHSDINIEAVWHRWFADGRFEIYNGEAER
jgi:hypothetical protein